MTKSDLITKAHSYLDFLCNQVPTRRVGTEGNQQANEFLADTFETFGFKIERQTFECIDWSWRGANLTVNGEQIELHVGPFSNGCEVRAPLVVASTLEELESVDAREAILLLCGELTREQLMPKNFPFYNPDHHKHIVRTLEKKEPRAILTATGRDPETTGAVYPFPLIEDGDFDIPSAYMTEEVGERLASLAGSEAALVIEAERRPSTGFNLAARKGPSERRLVISAHIDAKDNTPGALDNAASVVVLLLLAELLKDYEGKVGIELVPFNGEDHYSAAGEKAFLSANEGLLNQVILNINLDGAGSHQGDTRYSFYECPTDLEALAQNTFSERDGFDEGEPWYQGDHMVFVMNGVPALAITSVNFAQILSELAHTPKDNPEKVDTSKLVAISEALRDLIIRIAKSH